MKTMTNSTGHIIKGNVLRIAIKNHFIKNGESKFVESYARENRLNISAAWDYFISQFVFNGRWIGKEVYGYPIIYKKYKDKYYFVDPYDEGMSITPRPLTENGGN
ncbi:MAG: hypothetical protein ABII90_03620 [Bacteroidota bacterium]